MGSSVLAFSRGRLATNPALRRTRRNRASMGWAVKVRVIEHCRPLFGSGSERRSLAPGTRYDVLIVDECFEKRRLENAYENAVTEFRNLTALLRECSSVLSLEERSEL